MTSATESNSGVLQKDEIDHLSDICKHVSTVATGAVLILVAFREKFYTGTLLFDVLALLSFGMLTLAMVLAVVTQALLVEGYTATSIPIRRIRFWFVLSLSSFAFGVSAAALLGMIAIAR